ncbi:hypothetical protein EW145_g5525 [Phellinidium pouzarii]|uniref:Uncharacterized protein n=1 Tax=Phellinidium pouzarii TaxID=167371 RepID=A0A4S4KZW8_9AGAM|nr:hypothetical protein EW145_g5525 [Phellinidium pouzarii]
MPRGTEEEKTCAPVYNSFTRDYTCSYDSDVIPSTSTLRHRRELRYSRDQQALSDNLLHCTLETPPVELQITALESIAELLKSKVCESQQRISHLRERLSEAELKDRLVSKVLLNQLSLEELRSASTCREKETIVKQINQLRQARTSPSFQSADDEVFHSTRASRMDTNLSLFLQKSPTKRLLSLHSSRPRSIGVLSRTPRDRISAPEACRGQQYASHLRSRSLMDGAHVIKLYRDADVRQTKPTTASNHVYSNIDGSFDLVPAVDAFTNSFSSRVIAPTQSRMRPSLRHLRISTRRERGAIFAELAKETVAKTEYGSATILLQESPRHKGDLIEDSANVTLPSYVKNLMDEFEESNGHSLFLDLSRPDVPLSHKHTPLSPFLEESRASLPSTPHSSPEMKLPKKQRSIFSLQLPIRPVSDSASRSTLGPSSSGSDCTVNSLASPIIPLKVLPSQKGLPSTRNYDLSLLGSAPDDVPETPISSISGPQSLSTPKRSKVSRPFTVLRRVKSRLANLSRR